MLYRQPSRLQIFLCIMTVWYKIPPGSNPRIGSWTTCLCHTVEWCCCCTPHLYHRARSSSLAFLVVVAQLIGLAHHLFQTAKNNRCPHAQLVGYPRGVLSVEPQLLIEASIPIQQCSLQQSQHVDLQAEGSVVGNHELKKVHIPEMKGDTYE